MELVFETIFLRLMVTTIILQTLGMAIGTKMAPAYANLFMDRLERRLIAESQPVKPYGWGILMMSL